MEKKLAEETDAKERVEGYLKELQQKHQEALSTIENLNSRLNTTEEHNLLLTASIRNLGFDVPEIVIQKESDLLDNDAGDEHEKSEENDPPKEEQSEDTKTEILPSGNLIFGSFVYLCCTFYYTRLLDRPVLLSVERNSHIILVTWTWEVEYTGYIDIGTVKS